MIEYSPYWPVDAAKWLEMIWDRLDNETQNILHSFAANWADTGQCCELNLAIISN